MSMYTFSSGELQVLSDAIGGAIVSGSAEYAAAEQIYLGASPLGTVNPEYVTAHFASIVLTNEGKPHALFYDLAAEFAEFNGTPTDENVIVWLHGAAGVNRGTTTASDFIRNYTAAQVFARSGQSMTSQQLQTASDDIAKAVFADIEAHNGNLPDINRIGEHDAQAVIDTLGSAGLPNDRALWSGNLLFPGLGDGTFFEANFLESEGDTYDLFTAAYATQRAGYLDFLGAGASSIFTLYSNKETINDVIFKATSFLGDAYGFEGYTMARGLGLGSAIAGRANESDQLTGTAGIDFIHSGGGNDTIYLSESSGTVIGFSSDLIDGGAGTDTVALAAAGAGEQDAPLTVVMRSGYDGSVVTTTTNYSADVYLGTGTENSSYLFNVEEISLGSESDLLIIHDLTALKRVDASNHSEGEGDTVDVSNLASSINIDLVSGNLSVGDEEMSVSNFENVIGTSNADHIVGNSENNILVGGSGADTLEGGVGDDIFIIDAEDINTDTGLLPSGGGGYDIAYTTGVGAIDIDMNAAQLEVVVGGEGADAISLVAGMQASIMVAGGDGDDVVSIEDAGGTAVVWGGQGADRIYLPNYAGILVADVVGLTTENFASFNLNMLNLGDDFDWSEIDVVILNPEAEDRIFQNGGAIGVQTHADDVKERFIDGTEFDFGDYSYRAYLDPIPPHSPKIVSSFFTNFLSQSHSVTTSVSSGVVNVNYGFITIYKDGNGQEYLDGEVYDFEEDYDLSSPDYDSDWVTLEGGTETRLVGWNTYSANINGQIVSSTDGSGNPADWKSLAEFLVGLEVYSSPTGLGPWFTVGGDFFGQSLSTNGSIATAMPTSDEEGSVFEWLNEIDQMSTPDIQKDSQSSSSKRGSGGSDDFKSSTGDGTTLISDFDIREDTLELDGVAADPSSLPSGVTINQSGDNTIIHYGSNDRIILVDVNLNEWIAAIPIIVNGTSGKDVINENFVDVDGEQISAGGQTILAGADDDTIYDGAGDDLIYGEGGSDTFYAGDGADQYFGGVGGDDRVLYSRSTIGLTIDMTDGANSTGIAAGDTFSDIKSLYGTDYDDVIIGGAGAAWLYGEAGDDVLVDTTDAEKLVGGSGSDVFRFLDGDGEQERVMDFALGVDKLDVSLWGLTSLTDAGFSLAEYVNGQGDPQGYLMLSFNGNDVRIDGFTQADVASFTANEFIFAEAQPVDFAGATINGTSGKDVINENFVDVDGEQISAGGQTILAGADDDTIYDGAGDDLIYGEGGSDTFYAGDGADQYFGGVGGDDRVLYSRSTIGLTIDMTDGANSTGIAAGDTFSDIKSLYGTDYDDVIIGGAGAAWLYGEAGDDVLVDTTDAEKLVGGSGSDVFRFLDGDGEQERVMDFALGVDKLDVSLWGLTSLTDAGFSLAEYVNGQGDPQGYLMLSFNGNDVRIDGFTQADVASFTANEFIFA